MFNPKVLILDEPTTGLDPNQLVEIRQVIKNVGKNKTVFLSTHIMQEVERLCDSVVVVSHGRTVAAGTVAELLQRTGQQDFEEAFVQLAFAPAANSAGVLS